MPIGGRQYDEATDSMTKWRDRRSATALWVGFRTLLPRLSRDRAIAHAWRASTAGPSLTSGVRTMCPYGMRVPCTFTRF